MKAEYVDTLSKDQNPRVTNAKVDVLYQEFVALTHGLAKGHYPSFVWGDGRDVQTPVFMYHKVNPTVFKRHLIHLRENGYFTLTADDYFEMVRTGGSLDPKAVVLTFDDGLADLFTVVYPLLREFQLRAVVFVIPEWIGQNGMISWDQATEMHKSGVIDFQSHSLHHASIFVSEEIVDFFSGGHGISPRWEVPWDIPVVRRNGQDRLLGLDDLGSPIFKASSRLSDARRYFPDPSLEAACMEAVHERGAELVVDERTRRRLRTLAANYRHSQNANGSYETADEQREAIGRELKISKQVIERKLQGKVIRHFSFPWNQAGEIAKGLLRECGYESAYAGLDTGPGDHHSKARIYELPRVNGDFLLRLPGKGRNSLMRILSYKIGRRFIKGRPYW